MRESVALILAGGFLTLLAPALALADSDGAAQSDPPPNFDLLWDYGNPAATEQKFRAIVPLAEKRDDLSYLLQLRTQIARCQGLQGRFDDCHATLDAVEKRLTKDVPVARIRYLLERGRAFNSAGKPENAKPLFVSAWDQANATGETGYAIDAAHMVAIVDPDLDAQLDWNRKALAKAEAEANQKRWLPSILNNLGETYRARKQYDRALDCFERRAKCLRDQGQQPDIFTRKDIARMNRMLGRPEAGLAIIEPIAKDLQSKHQPNGYISAEYGQCLAAVGRTGEAKPFLVEAFEMLSKDDYMVKYEPEELRELKRLAAAGD